MENDEFNFKHPGLKVHQTNDIPDGRKDLYLRFQEKSVFKGDIMISQELYEGMGFTYEQMKTDQTITGSILYAVGALILKGTAQKSGAEASVSSEKEPEHGDSKS